MRILILPSWYPTPQSPVTGVFVREQATALGRLHDVRVLYMDVLPRGVRRRARRRIVKQDGYVEEIVEVPNLPGLWQFAYLWCLFRALRRLRRRFHPDLLHCHVAVPAGWGMVMLRRLLGLPIVLTEHNGQFENILARPGLRWMSGIAYRGADIVLAVGEGQRRFLQEHFPGIKRLQIVSNMVDTRRFVPSPLPPVTGDYRLLFVGLLGSTPVKGVHVLLDALALLKERAVISVHLDLVGDGEIRPEYEAQARRLGVDEMVTFHGLQPREKVARLLQESHALVLPSLSESQSVVVLEALASGRPVVATRCGGPEFLIDSTNGLVVEPGKARPLAEAIEQLLTTLDQYDPEAIAANATKRYSQESVTATLTEIYQHLIPAR